MRCVKIRRALPLRTGGVLVLSLALASACPRLAHPWGGEHHHITAAAMQCLAREEQEYLRPERSAITKTYCAFPDMNWPCYGQWGGGTGDPTAPRMPDTRRLWDISFYCQWDPVTQKGKGYPHMPPHSCEAARVFFLKAVDSLKKGHLEDGSRRLGVMLHYIEDTGSFPHVQPIHRVFHVKDAAAIRIEGYEPRSLGSTPHQAAGALFDRVEKLRQWTEGRFGPLLAGAGMPLDEAKRLAAKETMPPAVAAAVARLRATRPADYEAAATDCANECVRACADAIHSALSFAQKPRIEPEPNPLKVNLAFNPSFEDGSADGAPTGWCVGWLDPLDRAGRAEWYRAGTHFERHVRTGKYSLLLLWPPKKGLEWQQTWSKAIRVRPGEGYRGSAWGNAAATAVHYLALEFSGTDYEPLLRAKSSPLTGAAGWQQLSVDAEVPQAARWVRVILHSEAGEGAAWVDDVEVVRIR